MSDNNSIIEYERAILGLLLLKKTAVNRIRGYLESNDFYDSKNKILYGVIVEASDGGFEVDVTTISEQLKLNNNYKNIGGLDFMMQLIKEAALESNLLKYMQAIVEKTKLRKVKQIIKNIQIDVEKNDIVVDDLFEKLEQEMINVKNSNISTKDFKSVSEVADESIKAIQDRAVNDGISGLITEFPTFDDVTSGLQKGDLIIIAARPSMGKTAFALNLATNIAKRSKVAFFSLEMPARQLVDRVLASIAYIDANKLRESKKMSASEWTKLDLAKDKIKKLNLFIDDTPSLKLSELVWKARRLSKNVGIDLLILDYLQLLTISNRINENRQMEVSAISRTLKQLSRELDIPVIALSQLSRRVEQRENKRPMMSDIRESGAIEQDADIVAFLYREGYYNKDLIVDPINQKTELIISKHRNGMLKDIKFMFNPHLSLFSDDINGNKGSNS